MSRRLLAEFLGTFALVFFGAGSAAISYGGLTGIALAHGLILFIFITLFSRVSGAHFNPAVTFAMWMEKRLPSTHALQYIVAQSTASIAAAAMLGILLAGTCIDLGSTQLGETVNPVQGFLIETLFTFFLVFVIFQTQRLNNQILAPTLIGLTLTSAILVAGPLTGGSLNPARSLGPCLLSGAIGDLWLYFTAPLLGGFAAASLDKWLATLQD